MDALSRTTRGYRRHQIATGAVVACPYPRRDEPEAEGDLVADELRLKLANPSTMAAPTLLGPQARQPSTPEENDLQLKEQPTLSTETRQ